MPRARQGRPMKNCTRSARLRLFGLGYEPMYKDPCNKRTGGVLRPRKHWIGREEPVHCPLLERGRVPTGGRCGKLVRNVAEEGSILPQLVEAAWRPVPVGCMPKEHCTHTVLTRALKQEQSAKPQGERRRTGGYRAPRDSLSPGGRRLSCQSSPSEAPSRRGRLASCGPEVLQVARSRAFSSSMPC